MPTPDYYLLLPVLVQVLLTLAVFLYLAVVKARALKAGLVDLERRALHEDAWPENVQQVNNNIRNQFELPVLFYVLSAVLILQDAAGLVAQVLAWLFVISRIAHAYVHLGSNDVRFRKPLFMLGWIFLMALFVLASYSVIA